jgi:hypothetical protein
MGKKTKIILGSLVGLAILIQLVPYGRAHDNPPVNGTPKWDSPETEALARKACWDCHSNETVWPWYSWIAPVSWLVQHDVDEGREHLNFTEWNREQHHADEAGEEVLEGEMPLWFYPLLHPEAALDEATASKLASGLDATVAASPPGGKKSGESHDDHDHDDE